MNIKASVGCYPKESLCCRQGNTDTCFTGNGQFTKHELAKANTLSGKINIILPSRVTSSFSVSMKTLKLSKSS